MCVCVFSKTIFQFLPTISNTAFLSGNGRNIFVLPVVEATADFPSKKKSNRFYIEVNMIGRKFLFSFVPSIYRLLFPSHRLDLLFSSIDQQFHCFFLSESFPRERVKMTNLCLKHYYYCHLLQLRKKGSGYTVMSSFLKLNISRTNMYFLFFTNRKQGSFLAIDLVIFSSCQEIGTRIPSRKCVSLFPATYKLIQVNFWGRRKKKNLTEKLLYIKLRGINRCHFVRIFFQ